MAEDNFKFLSEIVASERSGEQLDIRSYTVKIKDELTKLEDQCLTDFSNLAEDVLTLHKELDNSCQVLNKIEVVVDSF
jgi:hypothetical protein